MTEFTSEYIKSVRMCSYLMEPPASEVVGNLCDHVERLQARVQELEGLIEFATDRNVLIIHKEDFPEHLQYLFYQSQEEE